MLDLDHRAAPGRPPIASIFLQSALSLVFVFSHQLRGLISNVGAVLTFFSALTVIGVLRVWIRPGTHARPTGVAVASALVFLALAVYMLWFAFRGAVHVLPWLAVISAFALGAWALTKRARDGARPSQEGSP